MSSVTVPGADTILRKSRAVVRYLGDGRASRDCPRCRARGRPPWEEYANVRTQPRTAHCDDATLLALIATGDQGAMIEFNERWFPQFLRLVKFLTKSDQDGEDVAQDAIVRAC